jgi:hypothetical protein
MAKLTDDLKDKIISDFNIGKSQNWLATNYNLSPATINKLCKGLIPKYKDKVNDVISIKTELANESEYQAFTFDKEVNEQLRRKNLIFNATEKIIKKATELLEKNKVVDKISVGDGIQNFEPRELNTTDLKNLSDTIDKASITLGVNQRHSNSQINVNTQNNVNTNNTTLTLEQAEKEALALGVPLEILLR